MLCDFNCWIRPQSWDWPKALFKVMGHQSVLLFKLSAISWHCIHPGCWLLLIPPWQQPPGRHPIIDTHSWLKIGCCKALAPLWHVQQRQSLSLFVTGGWRSLARPAFGMSRAAWPVCQVPILWAFGRTSDWRNPPRMEKVGRTFCWISTAHLCCHTLKVRCQIQKWQKFNRMGF